jgi:hypothetical protein
LHLHCAHVLTKAFRVSWCHRRMLFQMSPLTHSFLMSVSERAIEEEGSEATDLPFRDYQGGAMLAGTPYASSPVMVLTAIAVVWIGIGALVCFALMKAAGRRLPQPEPSTEVSVAGTHDETFSLGSSSSCSAIQVTTSPVEGVLATFAG